MRLDKIWTVALKDMWEFRTNKYIIVSLILMPLLMSVVMPTVYILPITMFGPADPGEPHALQFNVTQTMENDAVENTTIDNVELKNVRLNNVVARSCIFENCTLSNTLVQDSYVKNSTANSSFLAHSNLLQTSTSDSTFRDVVEIGEKSETEQVLELFIDSLLMFFVLIPAILPTIIASYSFVGEKLNKSLEPLLATPTSDLELMLGKSASIFLPTMGVTWLSFVPFVILVNALTEPVLGRFPLPDAIWVLGVFLLAPLICTLGISANIIISLRVSDVRASQQIGSLIVLPIVAFFIIILSGLITLSVLNMVLFILLMAGIDLVVIYLSTKIFAREEILVRWK